MKQFQLLKIIQKAHKITLGYVQSKTFAYKLNTENNNGLLLYDQIMVAGSLTKKLKGKTANASSQPMENDEFNLNSRTG